jgi:hypothetical protein
MSSDETASAEGKTAADILDATPATVLEEETPEPIATGNRRRRTGIALLTATGVVALAAAPFAMVAPHEHVTGESASSPASAHRKPAPKHPGTDKKKVVVPAPSWRSQASSQQPPAFPSPPESPLIPDPTSPDPTNPGSPNAWDPPADQPTPDPASSGEPDARGPRQSPADTTDSDPNAGHKPNRHPEVRPTPSATAAEHHTTPKPRRARPAPERIVKPPHWRSKVIEGTYVLHPGEDVRTNRMRLTLRTNGDLVLSDEHDKAVWSTGTHAAGTHVVFQADGNFVLYSSTNETLWSSRTDGHDGAVLVLRADGDLAITQGGTVLWHTGTAK